MWWIVVEYQWAYMQYCCCQIVVVCRISMQRANGERAIEENKCEIFTFVKGRDLYIIYMYIYGWGRQKWELNESNAFDLPYTYFVWRSHIINSTGIHTFSLPQCLMSISYHHRIEEKRAINIIFAWEQIRRNSAKTMKWLLGAETMLTAFSI